MWFSRTLHYLHCTFRSVLCFFLLKELSLCEFHCSVHEIGWHDFFWQVFVVSLRVFFPCVHLTQLLIFVQHFICIPFIHYLSIVGN